MISMAYGAGLRVSEVVNLKIYDLNFEEKTIHIRQSKGAKDRITILPEALISNLKDFISSHHGNCLSPCPENDYLFISSSQKKLTTRTLQKVFRQTLQKTILQGSGINPNASFHSLRHSFASHLVTAGVNLRIIQELLGHRSIRTTEIYTHVESKIFRDVKSPL
jgi:site-specific recombinase XerD